MSETADTLAPALRTRFLSHGTLGCHDLQRSRKFYEEFLGLETTQTSPISLMIRLGTDHVYAVVQIKNKEEMPRHYHNGLDVDTLEDVDRSHQTVLEAAEKWNLTKISKPIAQHGTYSFKFWDMDGNCWEILSNPPHGYRWIFEQGDLEGRGHFESGYHEKRPDIADK